MNPTLLQHPSSFELSLGPDLKYSSQDRSYSSLNALSTNDYVFSQAKRPNPLTNPSAGTAFGLEHNPQPLLSDPSFHTSPQFSVSPNDSINGSTPATGYSTLSTYAHTTLPKPHASNASASDQFNGVSGGLLSSSWADVSMTAYDRHKPYAAFSSPSHSIDTDTKRLFHSSSSFPSSAYSAHGLTNQYPPRAMDPRPYQTPTNSLGSSYVNSNSIMRQIHSPYPHNGHYYSHDHLYSDINGMPQADSNENKGPGFEETKTIKEIFNSAGSALKLDITAAIQKGFFEVDQKWTCYRRNYFSVTCSFQISPHQSGPFYVSNHGQSKTIEGWAVSISAKTAPLNNEDSQPRNLVQHTPKRVKDDETTPGRHPVSPQAPQQYQNQQNHHQHHPMHALAHPHHHASHISAHDSFYATHGNHLGSLRVWPKTGVNSDLIPPNAYTFERIQFQKATANNGKRRAQQQFFHIVVELSANVHSVKGEKEWVKIAEKVSDPMVVRGRSPGHYKDGHQRHDRSAHMDDRNGGHAPDNHRMSYGGYSNSSWGVQDSSRGQQSHYSGGTHRSCLSSSGSPPSGGSSATLHGSTDADFSMSDSETLKPTDLYVRPRMSASASETDNHLFSLSRKRVHEDDSGDDTSPYQFNSSLCESASPPVMDFPAFPQSKVLCASS